MSMMQFGIREAQRSFFDRKSVIDAVGRKRARVLSKFGAYVRTRAKTSMRKARQKSLSEMSEKEVISFERAKRRAAKEGKPTPRRPNASSKPGEPPRVVLGMLKKFLYFAYDARTGSVVIGPAKLGGGSDAPPTLEDGGHVTLPNGKTVEIKARPFMKPAFAAELPRVPSLWAGALDGK